MRFCETRFHTLLKFESDPSSLFSNLGHKRQDAEGVIASAVETAHGRWPIQSRLGFSLVSDR